MDCKQVDRLFDKFASPPDLRGREEVRRRRTNTPFIGRNKVMKGRSSPPATPAIGQNAKTLDELLQAIKDEYVYNTRV